MPARRNRKKKKSTLPQLGVPFFVKQTQLSTYLVYFRFFRYTYIAFSSFVCAIKAHVTRRALKRERERCTGTAYRLQL